MDLETRRRKPLGDRAGGSVHSLDLERGHQRIVNPADELDVQEPVLDDGLLFFVRGGGKPFGKKLVVAERFLSLEAHVKTALAVFSLPDLRDVLRDGLHASNPNVRNWIASSLGARGPRARPFVQDLERALGDPDERVRGSARRALDGIPP